jgi:pimeloyl-ACP methyl ester carboxylesterase
VSFPSVVRAIIAGERVLPELLEVAMPRIRRPYPSDLSDEEWTLLEPLLASSERRDRPLKWSLRRVVDAVFYLLRSGWEYLVQVATLRAQVGLKGQREILVDHLAQLERPTMVVWGTRDRMIPYSHAKEVFSRLPEGYLELISECRHLPQVRQPEWFVSGLHRF